MQRPDRGASGRTFRIPGRMRIPIAGRPRLIEVQTANIITVSRGPFPRVRQCGGPSLGISHRMIQENVVSVLQLEQIPYLLLVHGCPWSGLDPRGRTEERDVLRHDPRIDRPPFIPQLLRSHPETCRVGYQNELHGRVGCSRSGRRWCTPPVRRSWGSRHNDL
jgi:hypothetical protein